MCDMAPDSRPQLAASFSSCFRPSRVSVIELGTPVILALFPFCANPALLLELVQGRVERSVANLQYIARNLCQAQADRPAVQRLERQNFQDQEIESPLDKVGWSAHGASLGYRDRIRHLLSVSKWSRCSCLQMRRQAFLFSISNSSRPLPWARSSASTLPSVACSAD